MMAARAAARHRPGDQPAQPPEGALDCRRATRRRPGSWSAKSDFCLPPGPWPVGAPAPRHSGPWPGGVARALNKSKILLTFPPAAHGPAPWSCSGGGGPSAPARVSGPPAGESAADPRQEPQIDLRSGPQRAPLLADRLRAGPGRDPTHGPPAPARGPGPQRPGMAAVGLGLDITPGPW